MKKTISLAQMEAAASTPGQLIGMKLALVGNNYKNWLKLLEEAVPLSLEKLSENPELYQNHSEDQLTINVVNFLTMIGFQANHEGKVGGHCDINVRAKQGWLWQGEAKIFTSYSWILKGYRQLVTRYTTGNVGQNVGGLIIYSFKKRIDVMLSKWHEKLTAAEKCNCMKIESHTLTFNSKHPHARTGRICRTKHYPVSLHFAPKA